jgi:transcriptional regulator with XRE-family HTH domain
MTQLGDYLRACRARISPETTGLASAVGRRRVPGLRREELAFLAGISVDYVIRLEQGRVKSASPTVLLSLAEALGLNQDEKDYLLRVAAEDYVTSRRIRPAAPCRQQVSSAATQALLGSLAHVPALLLGRRMDILAWNQLGAALFTDFADLPPGQRNHIWMTFLHPQVRGMYEDWAKVARECVAYLRMDAARYPDDPELAELVGELSLRDNNFASWWADHRVRVQRHGRKRFRHPVAGGLDLDFQVLDVRDEAGQSLLVYTAEPDSSSADGLALLTSWAAAQGSSVLTQSSNSKEN